jgi:hypothetical protein
MNSEPDSLTFEAPTRLTLDDLEQRVRRRLNRRVRDFRLSLRSGGLVLEGQANTYYAKQLAQHAVMEAALLPIRANDIQVD